MKRWGWTGWAFAVSAVLAIALGGLVYHFRTRAASLKGDFDQASKDLDFMKKMRLSFRKLEGQKQRMPQGGQVDPNGYEGFLSKTASELGLPIARITPAKDGKAVGKWKEFPYTLSLNAAPSQAIPRAKVIRFMELIETQAPTFKSKELSMRFAPEPNHGDCANVTIVFSHFAP